MFAILLIAACLSVAQAATVDFARDVQPLIQKRCVTCHGPDQQMAGRLDVIRGLNAKHSQDTGDAGIASRIASYGVNREPTHAYARNCLIARRLVERGVRFVLVSHSTWDDHSSLLSGHKKSCEITDGLPKDTLVIWGGEFGRTPLAQTLQSGQQATMLHCLGLNHERLTYRYQGRDFRLTDVAGSVVQKL